MREIINMPIIPTALKFIVALYLNEGMYLYYGAYKDWVSAELAADRTGGIIIKRG